MTQNTKIATIELTVDGMDCANCAQGITRFLERKGLQQVYVNFQTKEVRFDLAPTGPALEDIKKGIHKLGYTVREPVPAGANWWNAKRQLLICALFTLPLIVGHLLMSAGIHLAWLHDASTQLALALPAVAIGGWHFGRSAWQSLRNGLPNMDVLIAIGGGTAFLYSLIGWALGEERYIFFETAATIFTLVLLGNWIEKRAVAQTTTAIAELGALQVVKARRLMPSGAIVTLDASELVVGDVVLVSSGDLIPADGIVRQGVGSSDEALLTGESLPQPKAPGTRVIGGALLREGSLEVQVTAVGRQALVGQMIELIKTAQQDKPPIQRLADRISAVFVPVVLSIAGLTLLLEYAFFDFSFQQAMMNAIAVLVISCPCAMGLATPTAVMVGVGRLARNGVLIKGGATVETLAQLRTLVFDKTGTLTTGDLSVQALEVAPGVDPAAVANLIHHLEKHSSHPIAQALLAHVATAPLGPEPAGWQVVETSGWGLRATDASGRQYRLGAARWNTTGAASAADVVLWVDDQEWARIALGDALRPEAGGVLASLQRLGLKTLILSGDRAEKTAQVAAQLGGVPFLAEQTPAQKLAELARLTQLEPTAMVGDGINDAPALAQATLGISLSQGSQVAIQSAQVILVQAALTALPRAIVIAQATLRTIRQNLFWAFSYNLVAIPIAALGGLNPMWGALFMAFSDVVVIGNSVLLRYRRLREPAS